jgi:hypothetical protein
MERCDTRQKLNPAATSGYGTRPSGYRCLTKTIRKWSAGIGDGTGLRPGLHCIAKTADIHPMRCPAPFEGGSTLSPSLAATIEMNRHTDSFHPPRCGDLRASPQQPRVRRARCRHAQRCSRVRPTQIATVLNRAHPKCLIPQYLLRSLSSASYPPFSSGGATAQS